MKKSYLVMAAAAALFAACSSNDLAEEKSPQTTQPTAEQAVDFDAYTSRGTTRAGYNGVIDNTTLKASTANFGVFGYYTDGESYSGITKPNFFYNQKVYWPSDRWYYEPVKYWPNEFGNDAISDQVDKVTFFAYAPYVEVEPLTGIVKSDPNNNIISMTRNNVTGDPFIRYSATMDPKNSTDLCYGVAAQDFTSSNSSVNTNNIKKGEPYKNVVKPGTDANSKIKFDFKHALAQLKVTIDANVSDFTTYTPSTVQTAFTRIWVRSITFEGITQKGALNLNSYNNTPEWYDINGANKITTGSLTVYDGRKDGREAMESAANESPCTLNEDLIQSEKYTFDSGTKYINNTIMGVETTAKPLFEGGSNIVFAIPTGEKMKVTIVYDVETVDPNLAFYLSDGETLGSTVENKITKTIEAFGDIKAGYCYNLNLHLGMRTVDFDAEVTGWQNISGDVDLPSNLPTFALGGGNYYVTLPAASATYDFAISGCNANETPSIATGDYTGAGGTGTFTAQSADASGIAKVSRSNNTANTTTSTLNQKWIYVANGGKNCYIYFTQAPASINFTNLVVDNASKLTCTWATLSDVNTTAAFNALASTSKGYIKVFKNGVEITSHCTFNSDKTIILQSGYTAQNGDVIIVELKANDAPVESRTITVSGLS